MTFTVEIAGSGRSFPVEAGQSVLDGALHQGFSLPYGCRNGACGACFGRIISGQVSYDEAGDGLPPALSREDADRGQALFCQAQPESDLVIEVNELRTARDLPIKTLPCRVVERRKLAHDVMLLNLKLPESDRLQFMAGQYVDILLKDGRKRGFSIANAPHDDEFMEMHIRHVPGGEFTDHVFETMPDKAMLRISGPLGTFFLRENSTRPIILMGGGTGFAPLKGMLEHAFYIGIKRPIHLFWGVRARRDLYMDELPRRWAEEHENFQYTPVLSEPDTGDHWQGETGMVMDSVIKHYPDLSGFDFYMGGPPVMVAAGKKAFLAHGLPENRMYYDSFDFANDKKKTDGR